MTYSRRRRRADSAREVPSAAARTAGANRSTTVLPALVTIDSDAITSPRASTIGAATDTASTVTCRSETAKPSRRI